MNRHGRKIIANAPEHGRLPGTQAGLAGLDRVLVVRLGPGEDVLPAMERLLLDAAMPTGVILGGVASLQHASVRNIRSFPDAWPIRDEDRTATTVPGPLEVLAMQGNVATRAEGGLVIHCHISFSVGAPPAVTYGGHLIENTIVATTCEVYVAGLTDLDVRRELDDETRSHEIAVRPTLRPRT